MKLGSQNTLIHMLLYTYMHAYVCIYICMCIILEVHIVYTVDTKEKRSPKRQQKHKKPPIVKLSGLHWVYTASASWLILAYRVINPAEVGVVGLRQCPSWWFRWRADLWFGTRDGALLVRKALAYSTSSKSVLGVDHVYASCVLENSGGFSTCGFSSFSIGLFTPLYFNVYYAYYVY